MPQLSSLDTLHLAGSWVTIGSFDGIHLGHQAVIQQLVQGAHDADLPAVVISFFPHPAVVLRGLSNPFYLSSPEERARLIAALGGDIVITLPFTLELAALSAEEFMHLLKQHLGIKTLLVGHDFALGRGRQGTIPALREIGERLGYTVCEVTQVDFGETVVSSSRIRALIEQGNVDQAALLLGRFYTLEGKVIPGDGRGRTIGIPTANLDTWNEQLLPTKGVYATRAWLKGQSYSSVTNVGLRPTFENQSAKLRVETHLLDFNQDLYGANLRLEFVEFLRPEQRFASVQNLIDQIQQDIIRAREVLAHVS